MFRKNANLKAGFRRCEKAVCTSWGGCFGRWSWDEVSGHVTGQGGRNLL